jgi:hypothetical protein
MIIKFPKKKSLKLGIEETEEGKSIRLWRDIAVGGGTV